MMWERARAMLLATVIAGGCSEEAASPAGGAAPSDAADASATGDGGAGDAAGDATGDAAGDATGDAAGDGDASGPPFRRTEQREPCAGYNPLRNPYFGDLHVHTTYSFDAARYDVKTTPAEAYAFARGEAVKLPPLDAAGVGTREVRLARPLDFVAVTDHAELLAETAMCTTEGAGQQTGACKSYLGVGGVPTLAKALSSPDPDRLDELCGADGAACLTAASGIWTELQESAEDFYDRTSACAFTTFVAYEYSGSPYVSNIHRNVIFRNERVPALPVSYFEEPTPQGLWAALRGACLEGDQGCDVLAIPHNSNWSNGRMFAVDYPGATTTEEQAGQAKQRIEMEPLVEIFQHKGDSECTPGLATPLGAPDELCGFEKLRAEPFEDCGDGVGEGGMVNLGCVSKLDFIRPALVAGLEEEARLGVNPYKLGIIASTDTHAGTPGAVEEKGWEGHVGMEDATPATRLGKGTLLPGGILNNAGGLAGVWAEENARDSLFSALRRRETWGTSGPRITVRFFGGWGFEDGMCADPALVEKGYEGGVPMGGDLQARVGGEGPVFVLAALRDPGTESLAGGLLQRAQIVKGWIAKDGTPGEKVYEVAGTPENGATVDLATCEPKGVGADSLCAVWRDPDFDPSQRAFYYARVVENPSCRYNQHECIALAPEEQPPACNDPDVPKTIQERAWTSPIWYAP